jgi:hypothetical protein
VQVFRNTAANDVNVADLYQFWLFLLLMVLSWIGMAVVVSIGDAICFEMLGKFVESCECMYTVMYPGFHE